MYIYKIGVQISKAEYVRNSCNNYHKHKHLQFIINIHKLPLGPSNNPAIVEKYPVPLPIFRKLCPRPILSASIALV